MEDLKAQSEAADEGRNRLEGLFVSVSGAWTGRTGRLGWLVRLPVYCSSRSVVSQGSQPSYVAAQDFKHRCSRDQAESSSLVWLGSHAVSLPLLPGSGSESRAHPGSQTGHLDTSFSGRGVGSHWRKHLRWEVLCVIWKIKLPCLPLRTLMAELGIQVLGSQSGSSPPHPCAKKEE